MLGLGLAAPATFAQSTGENAVSGAESENAPIVYSSPLPVARVAPPEQPRLSDGLAGAEGTLEDDDAGSVTVIKPGDEGPLRVVFNNRQNEGDSATSGPDEDRWSEERAKRFRKAPKARPLPQADRPAVAVPISTPRTGLVEGVVLRALDKMTGKTRTHGLAVGEVKRIERLRVRLDGCRAPGDGDSHGTIAYLNIWDTKLEDADPVFTGWMFAESPALSALDHPRYDLWVISCTTSPGEVSAARE